MKNKQFFTGLTAMVLSIGLVIVGCDNGSTDDGPTGPTAAELAAVELATTLGGGATASGTTVTLGAGTEGTTTLTAAVTVPAGVTLVVPTGKTLAAGAFALTIAANGTLNVDPSAMLKLVATSTLTIAGTLNITSVSVALVANFDIASGASITLAATAFVDTTGWNVSGAGAGTFYTTTLSGAAAGAQLKVRESTLQGLATGSNQADWISCPQDEASASNEDVQWNAGAPIVIQKGNGGAYSGGVSILSTNQNTSTGWFAKALEWKALD